MITVIHCFRLIFLETDFEQRVTYTRFIGKNSWEIDIYRGEDRRTEQ